MMRRHFPSSMTGSLSTLAVFVATNVAFSQEAPKDKPAPVATNATLAAKPAPGEDLRDERKRRTAIDKLIAGFDLTPNPLSAIPDNPPPHEGAMISLPLVVEPPDLVVVEVLEALPGRPISGERLVRPDGTVSLGFYGDISVRGLTPRQTKVAIIKHLREYLPDDALGLEIPDEAMFETAAVDPAPAPSARGTLDQPNQGETTKPGQTGGKPAAGTEKDAQKPRTPFFLPGEEPSPEPPETTEAWRIVRPEASTHVLVDISTYNHTNYYVVGDVLVPGRLPWTGNETVMDALQYAGGLLPTADSKNIRLVRPGRGGKPARVFRVDFEGIQEKGDAASNYQMFPGDRLVVGRDEVVKKTVEIDRLSAPIHSVVATMLQEASLVRSVQTASPEHADEVYKELVEFWIKQLSRQGDLKFDEQTLRDALLQKRKLTPPATVQPPK